MQTDTVFFRVYHFYACQNRKTTQSCTSNTLQMNHTHTQTTAILQEENTVHTAMSECTSGYF